MDSGACRVCFLPGDGRRQRGAGVGKFHKKISTSPRRCVIIIKRLSSAASGDPDGSQSLLNFDKGACDYGNYDDTFSQ